MTVQSQSSVTRHLLPLAALVVIIAGFRAAAPFLVPLVLALFLTIISLPVLQALRRLRCPKSLAVLLVVLLTFGFLGLVGLVGAASLSEIRAALPLYVDRFLALEHSILGSLEGWGVPVPHDVYAAVLSEPDRLVELASGVVRGAASLLSDTAVVAIYVVFMLLEASDFPVRLRHILGPGDADLSRYTRAVHDVQRYLAIKTAISLGTGVLVALWLWLIGIDFPLLWGAVAFLFNYIPNIGSLIAAAPAVLFALLQVGPGGAGLAALGYLAVNVGLGNVVEPQVMGRGFGLSTLVVVISLIFWGWLWGPVGMLLSVPLTMIVRIALEHSQELSWLAGILGGELPAGSTAGSTAGSPGEVPAEALSASPGPHAPGPVSGRPA